MGYKILLVGVKYSGEQIPGVTIETKGLCRPEIELSKAADALYEYDVVIINPESYSHFIFGKAGKYSKSDKELWILKKKNNDHDLDTVFDHREREVELNTALKNGTCIIWLLVPDKRIHFFGWRSLYLGYVNSRIEKTLADANVYQKKSTKLRITPSGKIFDLYFEQLKKDGWKTCYSGSSAKCKVLAESLEGRILCSEVTIGESKAWLMTSPCSNNGFEALIKLSLKIKGKRADHSKYHGIFLSHASGDKPFVRKLKKSLEKRGVKDIWIDEAELQIGDSLMKKIEDGLNKTKYVAVILSPSSIKSKWVQKELDIAINREIKSGDVVVLPILYKRCNLPNFLEGKVYADFTSRTKEKESLAKLLRKLRK